MIAKPITQIDQSAEASCMAFAWATMLALGTDRVLPEVLQACARATVDHLGATVAHILTVSPAGDLEWQAHAGLSPAWPDGRLPGAGLIEYVASERAPYVTNDLPHDARLSSGDRAWQEGLTAFAGYPLLWHGKLVGVSAAFSRQAFPELATRALAVAAGSIGLTIGRNRDYASFLAAATELKARNIELQEAGRRFQTVVEAAPNGILLVAGSGKVVLANAQAETMFGVSRDDLVGNPVEAVIPDFPRTRNLPGRAGKVSDRSPGITEPLSGLIGVRGDCTEFPVEIRLNPIEIDGATSMLCSVSDITERRRAEALDAARTQELIHANRELESFSYSVSHDLRAPLRHLDGFADLLRRNCYQQLDDQGKRYLDKISTSAQRMGRLIDDLLGFARLRHAPVREAFVSLGPVVEEVRRELEPDLAGRTVQWIVGDLPEVYGDRSLFRQVFANLLSNAVKYTRDRPEARIEIGSQVTDDQTAVFVRDNGAGFDMQYVDKLFRLFQRLHSREFDGTGVGLANVRRIVERLGGRVWAEGEVDGGATFYWSVPAARGRPVRG